MLLNYLYSTLAWIFIIGFYGVVALFTLNLLIAIIAFLCESNGG